jgi:outer membrane protein OmpA-like peptidoglycan-associated protein
VSSTSAKITTREKILLEGVRFKPDGSGLRPNSEPILDSAVELLKSHPGMKVYVDTYCDPIGGKRLNLRLSQQRAAIVSAYLEDHGIASDRLIARGFGATHFIARNETADGRAQNRRIELLLIE